MSREAHVRFCESVGVQFPHATRLLVERLWRSIKYEEVYLKAYQTVAEARAGINAYLEFYNSRGLTRPWATAPRQKCTRLTRKEGRGEQLKRQDYHQRWW